MTQFNPEQKIICLICSEIIPQVAKQSGRGFNSLLWIIIMVTSSCQHNIQPHVQHDQHT